MKISSNDECVKEFLEECVLKEEQISYKDEKGRLKLCRHLEVAEKLIEHTPFKYLRVYVKTNTVYLYVKTYHTYLQLTSNELKLLLRKSEKNSYSVFSPR